MIDVDHRLFSEQSNRLAADGEHVFVAELLDLHALARQFAIGGCVFAEAKKRAVLIGHRRIPVGKSDAAF